MTSASLHLASAPASAPASPPAVHADLTPAQHRLMVAGIVGLHVLGLWALLQVQAVREVLAQAAPMFVQVISSTPVPPAPQPPAVKPVLPPQAIKPVPALAPPPPVIAAPASPTPAPYTVAVAPPEPVPPPQPLAVAAPAPVAPATPPAPVAPPPPKIIPAAAVQFLEAPEVVYPRLSRRNAEAGQVLVRAYVDTRGGAPREVRVEKSSGHARLDEAALAAVHKARFRPYTENGLPVEGWALIPIHFELEK